jgi:hypothetical protein
VTVAAAFAAWLGASIIVLADGRKGLALGIGLAGAAFAVLVWSAGQPVGGIAILVGGAAAAALRLRSGTAGWGLMEPGSTPRIILTVVTGLVSLWIAASLATGGGTGPLRFAVLATLSLMLARVLQQVGRAVALCAAAGLALGLAGVAALAENGSGVVPYVVAAVIAAGVSALPSVDPNEPHGA